MIAELTAKVRPNSSFLDAASDQKAKITFHPCTWYAATEPSSHSLFYSLIAQRHLNTSERFIKGQDFDQCPLYLLQPFPYVLLTALQND